MMYVRLIVEFDGTGYAGWQRQPNGLSIQQVIEEALAKLLQSPVRTHSSGRTDAGVHARGMVIGFSTHKSLPLSAFREGLNRLLPPDIAVREANEVDASFHPRFDAVGKWYRYAIYRGATRSPLHRNFSWHLRSQLEVVSMQTAAASFVGNHDFAAFRSSGCEAKTTQREIFSFSVTEDGDLLYLDVRGNGFLKNMVRVMVGTLVEVGLKRRPVDDISRLLQEGDRSRAGRTAPPHGLCLMEVWY
ncbi:MAG TPA: tRNA pseudouridine(38-40) synthase TruA [Desulfuromonadales bacterium]|nr:tRNA pseudouridine(38-40) synthase TruA [Desulfuromonadales bacterium]